MVRFLNVWSDEFINSIGENASSISISEFVGLLRYQWNVSFFDNNVILERQWLRSLRLRLEKKPQEVGFVKSLPYGSLHQLQYLEFLGKA